jgi:hypothetical protein
VNWNKNWLAPHPEHAIVEAYLVTANVPGHRRALETVESAVGALVPLLVSSVAVPVVVAGALGGIRNDLIVLIRAVSDAPGRAVASAAILAVLDADSSVVKLADRAGHIE